MTDRMKECCIDTHHDVSNLEAALAYAIGEEKSRECVERLLLRYGSFTTIYSVGEDELCRVGGISKNAALLIKLIAYINSRRVTDSFELGVCHDELSLRKYIASLFLGLSVETVYVILLDDEDRVISAEHVSEGTVNASDIVPRKILEHARRKRSKRIILAHNHPQGSVTPSKDDVMTTGRLTMLFSTVGVRLVAHYIVADGEVGRIEANAVYNPDYKG